jgi:hypothetical protein
VPIAALVADASAAAGATLAGGLGTAIATAGDAAELAAAALAAAPLLSTGAVAACPVSSAAVDAVFFDAGTAGVAVGSCAFAAATAAAAGSAVVASTGVPVSGAGGWEAAPFTLVAAAGIGPLEGSADGAGPLGGDAGGAGVVLAATFAQLIASAAAVELDAAVAAGCSEFADGDALVVAPARLNMTAKPELSGSPVAADIGAPLPEGTGLLALPVEPFVGVWACWPEDGKPACWPEDPRLACWPDGEALACWPDGGGLACWLDGGGFADWPDCGGLPGPLVGAGGGLAGADVAASSSDAKGVEPLSWLVADACRRDATARAAAEDASDAILGTLDTGRLPETT